MAGTFGKGRPRNSARARPRAEDAPAIDVLVLSRAGVLDSNGTGELRCGDSSVAYQVRFGDAPVLALAFTLLVNGEERSEARQDVRLLATTPPLGGRRWWFECPRCGIKRRKLYLRSAVFACRGCQGMTYRSVQTHDPRVDALRRDQNRLEDVLIGRVASTMTEQMLARRALIMGPLTTHRFC